jgi:hypothetical protein
LKYKKATEGVNDQLLYFSSHSFLKDGRGFVFIRHKGESPNVFLKRFDTSEEKQLTFNEDGYLKTYIYYDGRTNLGLGKASVCFNPENECIYYIQGRNICRTDLDGHTETIARLPADQVSAYTGVSADGSLLCVPTIEAEALEDVPMNLGHYYFIDRKITEKNMNSCLKVYDTRTGKIAAEERIERAWITHVSFSPTDKGKILYNHEWASYDYGIRRMWIWDGTKHIMLRRNKKEAGRDDFVCHEVWDPDGKFIIYHGKYKNGPTFLGRVTLDGSEISEIDFPMPYGREGHIIPGKKDLLVTDGFYDNSNFYWKITEKMRSFFSGKEVLFCGKFITLMKVEWEKQDIQWRPLCRHGSDWKSQDSHPHPVFNPAYDEIYFNSNKSGINSIYKINIKTLVQE